MPGGSWARSASALALTASTVLSALAPGASMMANAGGGHAVEQAGDGIGFRAQLDPRHIAQLHHRAAGRGLQDDVAELLRRLQLRLGGDGGVDRLAWHGGLGADLAGGDLDVLRLDRR